MFFDPNERIFAGQVKTRQPASKLLLYLSKWHTWIHSYFIHIKVTYFFLIWIEEEMQAFVKSNFKPNWGFRLKNCQIIPCWKIIHYILWHEPCQRLQGKLVIITLSMIFMQSGIFILMHSSFYSPIASSAGNIGYIINRQHHQLCRKALSEESILSKPAYSQQTSNFLYFYQFIQFTKAFSYLFALDRLWYL